MRGLERAERARRRGQPQGGDELVEAPVAARGLPGGAGRREPADRRVLERLRKVAQSDALRGKRFLRLGSPEPRPEGGGHRGVVDLDALQAPEIQRDEAFEGAPQRLHAPNHARAPAERHHPDALPPTDLQHARKLVLAARQHDRIWRIRQASGAQAHQVRIAAAGRPPHAMLVAVEHGRLAHRLGDRWRQRKRRGNGNRLEGHVLFRLRLPHLRAQRGDRARPDLQAPLRVAPAPPLHMAARASGSAGRPVASGSLSFASAAAGSVRGPRTHDSPTALSIPSRASSRRFRVAMRIIGEPSRESPRSRSLDASFTEVPAFPSSRRISRRE